MQTDIKNRLAIKSYQEIIGKPIVTSFFSTSLLFSLFLFFFLFIRYFILSSCPHVLYSFSLLFSSILSSPLLLFFFF